ncbi:MAG: hypothetical protein NT169_27985 [Chloroflexi bacterium]|nr:hypothetical protein [Chloroflexota bacterium]
MTDLPAPIAPFIARWRDSGAAERANYQLFLSELRDVLEVARPQPTTPDEAANAYVFEKSAPLPHGATRRIDLILHGGYYFARQSWSKLQMTWCGPAWWNGKPIRWIGASSACGSRPAVARLWRPSIARRPRCSARFWPG